MVSKRGILLWFWCCAPAFGWPHVRFARPRSSFIDSSAPTQSLQYRQGSASEDDYSTPKILSQAVLPQVVDTSRELDESLGSGIISNPENSPDEKRSSREELITNLKISLATDSLLNEQNFIDQRERSQFAGDLENKLKPKQLQQVDAQRNLTASRFQLESNDRFQRVRPNVETTLSHDISEQQSGEAPSLDPRRDEVQTVSSSVDAAQLTPDDVLRRDILTRWSKITFDDRVEAKAIVTEPIEVENLNDNFLKDVMKHRVFLDDDEPSIPDSVLSESFSDSKSSETTETLDATLETGVPFFVESRDIFDHDSSENLASMDENNLGTTEMFDAPRLHQDQKDKGNLFRWPNPTKFLDNLKDQMQLEPVDNVSNDAIKGAAMMGLMLATVGSGGLNLVAGGSAAALTSFLAMTKGTPGDVVRATGSSLWDIAASTVEAAKVRQSSRTRRGSYIVQEENATETDLLRNDQIIAEYIETANTAINQLSFQRELMSYRLALEKKESEKADDIESETFVPFFLSGGYYENPSYIPPLQEPASPSLSRLSEPSPSEMDPSNQREVSKRTTNFSLMLDRLKKRLQFQRHVISLEAKLDVDDDTIKGAAISGMVLATIGTGGLNLPVSASVAAVTTCLAMTKGAAGEVSRAIGDYAWEVVLSAREVLTPERQQVLKRDFAEGWLQFGLTLMEGTVSVVNATKEAISDFEKRMTKLENERKMELFNLQRSRKQVAFHQSMMKRRLSLEKAGRLLQEQQRLQQEIMIRQQRDQLQVAGRRGLMSRRFILEGGERAKRAEEIMKDQLLAEKAERERVETNTRTELMTYRFILEAGQRAKRLDEMGIAQVLAENTERERKMVKSRQEMMLCRFLIEREQRAKRLDEMGIAQVLAENTERERKMVISRQEMMLYRFLIEHEQRAKRLEEMEKAQVLAENTVRDRKMVKSRQRMMLHRFLIEHDQRAKRLEDIKKAKTLTENTERERMIIRTRREMMVYRLKHESEQRVTRADEMRKSQILSEHAKRERLAVQPQREMMLYRFVIEQEQRTKQAEAVKKAQLPTEKVTADATIEEENRKTMMPLLTKQTKISSRLVTKLATALVLSYLGFVHDPPPPPSLFNPGSMRVRKPYTFPVYQFELP